MSYFLCLNQSTQNYHLAYYPLYSPLPLPFPTATPTWLLPLPDFPLPPTQDTPPKDSHDAYEPQSVELREESGQNRGGRAGRPKRRKYRNHDKNVESARKNGELNIINQFFSFYKNRAKSEKAVAAILRRTHPAASPQAQRQIYAVMNLLTSRKGRKYINLKQFLNLLAPAHLQQCFPDLQAYLSQGQDLSLVSLCDFLRHSLAYYMQHVCLPAVLTSRRIVGAARQIHLQKRRKIIEQLSLL